MSRKHTSATPANVSRSRSRWTRRQRAEIVANNAEIVRRNREWEDMYGDDDYDQNFDDDYCDTCDNTGVIVTCCDDICVGRGECMHGDGEQMCPGCGGEYL